MKNLQNISNKPLVCREACLVSSALSQPNQEEKLLRDKSSSTDLSNSAPEKNKSQQWKQPIYFILISFVCDVTTSTEEPQRKFWAYLTLSDIL